MEEEFARVDKEQKAVLMNIALQAAQKFNMYQQGTSGKS